MVDVFISYSRTDLAKVTQLAQAVEAEGYQVWWDADLPPHLSYGDVITAKIGMCKAAIVVWSEAAAASEWVRAEADMARNQKKLVQTALDNIMPPLPFNQIQYAEIGDWHGESDHPGWRKVKVSLAELCGKGTAPDPRPVRPADPVVQPPPDVPPTSKWPLYAGIGVGAVALAAAGWVVLRQPSSAPPEEQAVQAEPAAGPEAAVIAPAPVPAEPAPEVAGPPTVPTEGMTFPDSDRRLLTPAEVANLGPATLELARNEIFARKGRRFRRADLQAYFSRFDWYRPVADEVTLNRIEQQNVALLRRAEARFGQ